MASQQPPPPQQQQVKRPISEEDRKKVRDAITHFISKIEVQRGQQPDEVRIRRSVQLWEEKGFLSCNGSREMYVEKYNQKKQTLENEVKKHAAAAAAAATGGNPQQQQQQYQQQQHQVQQQQRPVPQQQARPAPAAAAPRAAAPRQQPQPQRTSPAPPPPPPVSQQPPPPVMDAQQQQATSVLTKEFLETVREPLDQCRTILRILSTVFQEKLDAGLKQEFVEVFQKTTDLLKKRLHLADLQRQTGVVTDEVFKLRAKLEPRIQKVSEHLKLTFAELVEVESQPFGLLQRTVEIHGTSRFAVKAKRISGNIGGRACLKHARESL